MLNKNISYILYAISYIKIYHILYMPFLGTLTERVFREKSKAHKHIQMMQRCAPNFFLGKHARLRSRVLDFFPGFTDKG